MSTHLPRFRSFFRFFHNFVLAKSATSSIRVNYFMWHFLTHLYLECTHSLTTYDKTLFVVKFNEGMLTLPMLRLLSSKAQGRKDFRKLSKRCHVGTHLIALTEYSQMSTHVPGFQSFLRFFVSFCIGKISHQQHKG